MRLLAGVTVSAGLPTCGFRVQQGGRTFECKRFLDDHKRHVLPRGDRPPLVVIEEEGTGGDLMLCLEARS